MSKNGFDWGGVDEKSDIIFPTVQAVAVYQNVNGQVVIRQQDHMGGDDSIVVIPIMHIDAFIAAVKNAAVLQE